MKIQSLRLRHYRNHVAQDVEWAPGFNLLIGPNGSGKTNLVDAIHVLCMSRSFVSAVDRVLPTRPGREFELSGRFESASRSPFTLSCTYSTGDGKRFFVNDSPLDRLPDLIGRVPVVVMSPEDRRLTAEGPQERRAFLDQLISQLSKGYLQDLIRYRRIRRQRNSLLLSAGARGDRLRAALEPWDLQLAQIGAWVVLQRHRVLARFESHLREHLDRLATQSLEPRFDYRTFCDLDEVIGDGAPPADGNDEAILTRLRQRFLERLEEAFEREQERGQTLVGPHRDEIVFRLGDLELRKYGSQGQHRLFSMALKLAQYFYYRDELDDEPILLLDDVFGNLDPVRAADMLDLIRRTTGQVFITSATSALFEGMEHVLGPQGGVYRVTPGPDGPTVVSAPLTGATGL